MTFLSFDTVAMATGIALAVGCAMRLRTYQNEALTYVTDHPENILLVSPTGSGKTVIGASIVAKLGLKTLWITHREELAMQAHAAILEATGIDAPIIMASVVPSVVPSVVIASVATLINRTFEFEPQLIIIDECHHAAADTWQSILARFHGARRIGLTATPIRADGVGLGDIFDDIYTVCDADTLIHDGYLVPMRIFAGNRASNAMSESILDAYNRYSEYMPTLIFANNVLDAQMAVKSIGYGEYIDCDTPNRKAIVDDFRTGKIGVLASYGVLLEGFDAPNAAVAIIARRFSHVGTWIQACGRVSRPSKYKFEAKIIDLCGNVHEYGHPYSKMEYSLIDRPITINRKSLFQCKICGRIYESRVKCCDFQPDEIVRKKSREVIRQEIAEIRGVEMQDGFDLMWLRKQISFAKHKGFSNKWAPAQYKNRYGVWPKKYSFLWEK